MLARVTRASFMSFSNRREILKDMRSSTSEEGLNGNHMARLRSE